MSNKLEDIIKNTPDGSVASLGIADTLDGVDYSQRTELLAILCKKVRYSGFIELTGTDLSELIMAVYQGYVDTAECNGLLYGPNQHKSVSNLEEMTDLLRSNGFKIVNERRNKYIYYVKAERIAPNDNK